MAITVTSSEFRDNQASLLDQVSNDKPLILLRKKAGKFENYLITKIEENEVELVIKPELQKRIDRTIKEEKL